MVVLVFWGSWCGPWMGMVPHERRLVGRLAGRPFALVGVNSDRDRDEAKRVAERERITWPPFWNGGGVRGPVSAAWRVRAWPTVYVLDADGVIRHRDVRGEALDRAVDELLAELDSRK